MKKIGKEWVNRWNYLLLSSDHESSQICNNPQGDTLGDYFVHLLTPCHQGPWDMELISQIKFNHAFDLKFKINIKFL